MRRLLTSLLLIATLLITALSGCQPVAPTLDFAAGGTIPLSEKCFPIVNEGLSMSIYDEGHILSDEDIRTLTRYTDRWASINDDRGKGFLVDEVSDFVSEDVIEDIVSMIESDNEDYEVLGTQILSMTVRNDEKVEIVYVVSLSGCNPDAGIQEGTYESVHGLLFEKQTGKWVQCGVSFVLMAEAGSIEYTKDAITGRYTITPTGDYIT